MEVSDQLQPRPLRAPVSIGQTGWVNPTAGLNAVTIRKILIIAHVGN